MNQKSKKPADDIIKSVLEDLKKIPDDSIVIGPEGIEGSDIEKENVDKTTVLGEEYTGNSENEFRVDERSALADIQKKIGSAKKNSTKPKSQQQDPPADETLVLGEKSSKEESSTLEIPEGLIADSASQTPPPDEKPKDETLVATPHRRSPQTPPNNNHIEPKVSFGGGKGKASSFEVQFAQAENLKMAQQRILELEKEVERLRKENEVLSSASEISRQKIDDLITQVYQLEKQKNELREVNESELEIFKEGLAAKESEILRLRSKVEELESRLSNDLRKVRVRERELENRLELAKAEKGALLRAKDDAILELKRKTENLESEIEGYQNKIIELGQKLELNHDQFARTVRALRLALTNLEVSDGTSPSITLAPLKKAE